MLFEDKPLLQFNLFRVPMKFHASAILNIAFALFYLFSPVRMLISVVAIILIILVHELGHAAVCALCGRRVESIDVAFAGGTCAHEECEYERQEILIAWGGVFGQLVLALAAVPLYLLLLAAGGPAASFATVCFVVLMYQDAFTVIYNLLPLPGFDGARAWGFLTRRFRRAREDRLYASLRRVSRPAARTRPRRRREPGVSAEAKAFADQIFEEIKRKQSEKPEDDERR
jgi:Zn-dependent protease